MEGKLLKRDVPLIAEILAKHAAKWRLIGNQLGFSHDELDAIQSKVPLPDHPHGCLSAMLEEWSQWPVGDQVYNATIDSLARSLRSNTVRLGAAADELKENLQRLQKAHATAAGPLSSPESPHYKLEVVDTTVDSQFTFPSIVLKNLTSAERSQLEARLYSESNDMIFKFNELFGSTFISLKRRSIPVSDVVDQLVGLSQLPSVLKDSKHLTFRKQFSTLQSAKSIDDVKFVVIEYCSFFNYQILEHLIKKLGTDEDKKKLEEYEAAFNEYAQRKVYEMPSNVQHVSSDSPAIVYITLDDSFNDCAIQQLRLLQIKLCKVLHVSVGALQLCFVKLGSLILKFQVALFAQPPCTPLSSQQGASLRKLGVISIDFSLNFGYNPQDSHGAGIIQILTGIIGVTTSQYQKTKLATKSSTDNVYNLKVLLYKLSQQLSKEESNALVTIEELPARLRDEKSTPFDVLMQLNMQGRFSPSEDSKFEELAKIFKNINRFDLASQVKEFAKRIKKSKKGKPEHMQQLQLHSPTQKLETQLRVTQLQHYIFTDQIEELLQAANEAGQIRVKGLVDESKSYIEKTSKKLRYIAGLLAAEKEKRLSRSSSLEEETSPVNSRLSQPRASITYASQPKQVSQCEESTSTDSYEDEFIEINANTGDSGFADSKEFLKTEPQKLVSPKKPPAQTTLAATGYTGLNKKTMDRAAYYKTTRSDAQDVVYVTTTSARDPDPVYANLPSRQKIYVKKEELTKQYPTQQKSEIGYKELRPQTLYPTEEYAHINASKEDETTDEGIDSTKESDGVHILPGVSFTHISTKTITVTSGKTVQTLLWKEHGLKIHIAPGTLAETDSECSFTLGVTCKGESLQFPPTIVPVSPVFYIKPSVRLHKPVTLEIEHCCMLTQDSESKGLAAMLASTTSQTPPYKFNYLDGGDFPVASSWGQVSVSSFTLYTIVYDFLRGLINAPIVYFAKVYFRQVGRMMYRVGIATSRNLSHCKAIIDETSTIANWNFISQFDFQFGPGNNTLLFLLPEDNVIPNSRWKIKASVSPCEVTKSVLDNCECSWCELSLWWTKSDNDPVELDYSIEMEGISKDNFEITIDPLWQNKTGDTSQTSSSTLELRDAFKVLLPMANEWQNIMALLGLPNDKMRAIKSENSAVNDCLRESLSQWLKQTSPPPSWEALAETVELLGDYSKAREIKELHGVVRPNTHMANREAMS